MFGLFGLLYTLFGLPLYLLPGLVLLRRRDTAMALTCLGLGAAGYFWFGPLWAAGVVLAGRRAAFAPLRPGSPLPALCRAAGVLLMAAGAVQAMSWAAGVGMLWQSHRPQDLWYMAQIITGCALMLAAGAFMLAAPALRPRPGMLWAGLMAAAALWPAAAQLGLYALGVGGAVSAVTIPALRAVGCVLAAQVLLQPVPAPDETAEPGEPAPPAKSAPPAQPGPPAVRLVCVSGPFAGAQLPLADGETLCLGSSPELAHLVLAESGVAPLHAEVSYQQAQGGCVLAHAPENAVYLNGRPAPALCTLRSGEAFYLGEPQSGFVVQFP